MKAPKIIAEIGCNHKGDMQIAKEMIMTAATYCKVDVVKFQKRCNRELLTPEEYNAPHPHPENSYGKTYGEHREFLEFSLDQHRQLQAWCNEYGIEYSTSVWDVTSAKEICTLKPKLIKVPSACNLNKPMLTYLCDNFEGEIHLSFGMTTREEEEQIVSFFEEKDPYFRGERELFEGLKIMQLEQEWEQCPVIRLDLSSCKGLRSADSLREKLMQIMKPYTDEYGQDDHELYPGDVLYGLIRRAYTKTGQWVVVLVDGYDTPLQDVLHEEEVLGNMRKVMAQFLIPLKAQDRYLKFCFITGVTKVSLFEIFENINHVCDESLSPEYSAICGFSDKEVATALKDDVAQLAEACNMTCEQMHEKLKLMYGGYHFSERSPEVFNPFSLLSAFSNKDIREYWINNDSLSLIMSQLKCQVKDIMAMDNTWGLTSDFVHATMGLDTLLLLYQSGYLTIKSWEREDFGYIYTLSIPNQEVRTGLINHS